MNQISACASENPLAAQGDHLSHLKSLNCAFAQLIWQRECGVVEVQPHPESRDLEGLLSLFRVCFLWPRPRGSGEGPPSSNALQALYCHAEVRVRHLES